ncbi:MAG TPA: response regulator [bacterium]|nr:response regulator [bacterium]
MAEEIEKNKQMLEDLKNKKEQLTIFEEAIESSINAVCLLDKDFNISFVNLSFLKILGYEKNSEIIGLNLSKFINEKNKYNNFINEIEIKNFSIVYEIELLKKDNSICYAVLAGNKILDANNDFICNMISFIDISETVKLKEQLIKNERLSAIGQLTAGVAHEFNNILSILKGYSQLLLMNEIKDENEIIEIYKIFNKQVELASNIIAQMNLIVKPKPLKKDYYEISLIIDELLEYQQKQINKENIKIITDYKFNLPILVDKDQIQQVLLNLIINARHAILPKGKGEIKITTQKKDNNVLIIVEDNGIGIKEEIKHKLFTPFFSTKGAYAKDRYKIEGIGLGLSVALSIIKNHNGTITFESVENIGTKFIISLPLEIKELSTEIIKEKINLVNIKNKDIKILIVDDEKDILQMIKHYFKNLGLLNVTTVNNGNEAIELLKNNKYDIIFLDIIMPDITGEELFEKIKEIDKAVPIVFISGQIEKSKDEYIKKGVFDYITKPFTRDAIINIINKI